MSAPGARAPHWPVLDGLRGLAILLVIGFHLGSVEGDATSIPARLLLRVYDLGWIGVDLFFVLSGFLITSILIRELDSPRYFRDFYIRRTLRIFPVFYLLLILRFLIVPLVVPSEAVAGSTQIWAWLYVSNWIPGGLAVANLPHIWSLALEEQFYLVWPAALWLVPRRRWPALCLAAAAAAFAWRVVFTWRGNPLLTYEATVARLDPLALGALVAVAGQRARWRAVLGRYARVGWWIAAALTTPFLVLGRWHPLHTTFGFTAWALLFACTIARYVYAPTPTRGSQILGSRPLRFIGTYSYGTYLWHMPIHLAVYPRLAPYLRPYDAPTRLALSLLYVVAMFGVILLLAVVSYRGFERRFLALKDVLAPPRATPPAGDRPPRSRRAGARPGG